MNKKQRKEQYYRKLKDPRWQKKRLEILSRDEWYCQLCQAGEYTLHVHHRYYENGKDPWDYPNESLVTLCEFCHESEKEDREEYELLLLQELRKHFFADSLREIAWGFNQFKLKHVSEVHASAISYFLQNEDLQCAIIDLFFEDLAKKRKERESHGSENSNGVDTQADNVIDLSSHKA